MRTPFSKGERVILVDDLIATGGTAEGAVKLLRQMGRKCSRPAFVHRSAPNSAAPAKLRAMDVPVRHVDLVRRALSSFGNSAFAVLLTDCGPTKFQSGPRD